MLDLYATLGIGKTATPEEMRNAYKQLAKRYHPDVYTGNKNFAETKMQEINLAYETLSDPGKRSAYDRSLLAASKQPTKSANPWTSRQKEREQKRANRFLKTGKIETWAGKAGTSALGISLLSWVMLVLVSRNLFAVSIYLLLTAASFLFLGKARKDLDVDVFSLSLIMALSYTMIYAGKTLVAQTEPFSPVYHLALPLILSSMLSLLPSTVVLIAAEQLRIKSKQRDSKKKSKKQ